MRDKITILDKLKERQNDHHFDEEIKDKGYPVLKQLSHQQVLKQVRKDQSLMKNGLQDQLHEKQINLVEDKIEAK